MLLMLNLLQWPTLLIVMEGIQLLNHVYLATLILAWDEHKACMHTTFTMIRMALSHQFKQTQQRQ